MEISIKRKPKKKPKTNSRDESTITEMKNSLEGIKGRFEQAEQSVNLNTEQFKLQHLRNRKEKKSEQSLRDLWDTIRCLPLGDIPLHISHAPTHLPGLSKNEKS